MSRKPIFIAEIKTKSPFGFESFFSFGTLMETAIKYGDWISVHTNPLFGGSYEAIEFVKRFTNKPILAKGFHSKNDEIRKAIDYGADYVLVVDRLVTEDVRGFNTTQLIHEIGTNLKDHLQLYSGGPLKFAYNGRNLKTGLGKKSIADYADYRKKIDWLCGTSLLHDYDDVQKYYPDCDAFIVGANLMQFCESIKL